METPVETAIHAQTESVQRLDALRQSFVDGLLLALVPVGALAVANNIWRASATGWLSAYGYSAAIFLAIAAVALFRRRLPRWAKTAALLGLMILEAFQGLSSFALASVGLIWLPLACLVAAVILPGRAVWGVVGLCALVLAAAGFAYVSGIWSLSVDLNRYVLQPSAWLGLVIVVIWACIVGAAAVGQSIASLNQMATALAHQRDEIARMASHDGLTGLPVLRVALDRAQMALQLARRTGQMAAVLFIDLDGFKVVNDTFGHEAGDHVLRQVALRLQASLREVDTVARVGGDEFMVVLGGLNDGRFAGEVAEKLIGAISEPIPCETLNLAVSASVGVALYPIHAQDLASLRRIADQAMYRAKRNGKGTFTYARSEHAA
jgi:diguanylate cyclase (GGDEF)-like protein